MYIAKVIFDVQESPDDTVSKENGAAKLHGFRLPTLKIIQTNRKAHSCSGNTYTL
jgi:hypothetical protein